MLRGSLDPSLWYRGSVGIFFFCFETIFLSLAVLMTIYMSELTSAPDDEIDFARGSVHSKSNSACGPMPSRRGSNCRIDSNNGFY